MPLLIQPALAAAPATSPETSSDPNSSPTPLTQHPSYARHSARDLAFSSHSQRARATRAGARPSQPATTLTIPTPHGPAHGLWRPSSQRHAAVLLLPGADNLLGGPDGLFDALAPMLQRVGAVAQLAYPRPGDLDSCREDILAALDALNQRGIERVALIGWGFGDAVAASVASRSPLVSGLVRLAPDRSISSGGDASVCADPDRNTLLEQLARWASEALRSPFRAPRHSLRLSVERAAPLDTRARH